MKMWKVNSYYDLYTSELEEELNKLQKKNCSIKEVLITPKTTLEIEPIDAFLRNNYQIIYTMEDVCDE